MKAILEFALPEEHEEHANAVHGTTWRGIVQGMDNYLRDKLKHGKDVSKDLDEARTQLHDLIRAEGLDLYS